jgi:hypothetical protein
MPNAMEYSLFEERSRAEVDAFEPAREDRVEEGTTTDSGMLRRAVSLARHALSQARSTTQRVQAEAERLVQAVRRRTPWSDAGLQTEAGRLLGKLEDRVVRLRKDFQELERIHHVLNVGTAPLQEVQDLQRRIGDMEKRLGDARSQATQKK